jgi:transposase
MSKQWRIWLLHDHREQLVHERTRLSNRLRVHLLSLDPELEAQIPMRGLDQPVNQAKIRRRLATLGQTARIRIARRQLAQITTLSREIVELHHELDDLTTAHNPALRQEQGVEPVTAAILIGQTADAERFTTDAKFARQAGTAPIPASSGKTQRHRLHRGGNRQLNKAIHIIALVRARTDPTTRAYLDRKRAEGKTAREALRCLKRHLARRIWRLLYGTTSRSPAGLLGPTTVAVGAPGLMPCTR